jgi:hypothetical protein
MKRTAPLVEYQPGVHVGRFQEARGRARLAIYTPSSLVAEALLRVHK